MSTLTEKIAETLEAHAACDWDSHEFVDGRYQAVWYCPCGEKVPLADFRQHESSALAAAVAEWLDESFDCDLIDSFTVDSLASAEALEVIAAEAVKGAGQ